MELKCHREQQPGQKGRARSERERGDMTFNRRHLIKAIGVGVAASALPGTILEGREAHAGPAAHSHAELITRNIPRSGEAVPAIGLGSFMTFDVLLGQPRDHLQEVVRRFWLAGGRVFDVSPLYGMSEANLGEWAGALGINQQMFIANKIWSTGEYAWDDSHAARSLQRSRTVLMRDKIDVMQCHSLVNADVIVPLLRAWKKEGRIRYVCATHHEPVYFPALAQWVDRGDLDFVQVHYSIHTRAAEERIFPAAVERGTAVLVNMPLEKARLHKIVAGRPLPEFAKELGIETWAQFFLKWVLSHPAVTCAIPATTNPDHVLDNALAMRGPLPDRAMRARMVRHMQSIPGFDTLGEMPWYPDKQFDGLVSRAQRSVISRT